MDTAKNKLHLTEFSALMMNPGLEHFVQEKLLIMAYLLSSPPPASNKEVHMICLHLAYCHGVSKDYAKEMCLKGIQLSSTLPFHGYKRL